MRATPPTEPENTLPPPPTWALALTGVCSLALGALCLLRGFQGATASPPVVFGVVFDALGVLAAVFGVLAALGRFNFGPAMALASVAAVSIVCAGLGFDTANRGGYSAILKDPMVLARIALSGGLLALASVIVLLRDPKQSFRRIAVGMVLLVVAAALIGLWTLPPLRAWLGSQSVVGKGSAVVALLATATLVVGFLSAGGHNLIRAFEFGSAKDAPAAPQIK
ncbi:MAG: hypothetical protein ACTS27_09925 [Phycisphaerales bacterium]